MASDSLKLITLNCWGGREAGKLLPFFEKMGKEVDVFCLQEMYDADQRTIDEKHPEMKMRGDLFRNVRKALPGHMGCFAYFDDNPDRMSLALFVRHGIEVRTLADFIVHRPEVPQETGNAVLSPRKLQYVTFSFRGRDVTVGNYHGLWVNGPKTDTPERMAQGERVRNWLDGIAGPKILCGDFNLLPENASLRTIDRGLRNLVIETGVKSTRTPLYRHYENPAEPNFADYVIVSPDVDVRKFAVLPDAVSDHAALYLEFS
ncbi:MAG TPA: endonuclease/exonuclease/phosphatase family protein [Patescibacteria group bacterium]|nr:endonuclease/exonuclease/phosphatase family protein [Patescibacteria group bacterium]